MLVPHRVSAAFPMKFDGPIVDTYRMEEQTLVDVSTGLQPGMTTLPHLQSLVITGPLKVSGVSDTPSRKKIFSCRPANTRRRAGNQNRLAHGSVSLTVDDMQTR